MGPFAVSASGVNVQAAAGPKSLLSLNAPMTKLDTTNIVSFQTISLLFNHEPAQPTYGAPTDTLLYQFAHGYTYIPAIWLTWQNPAPAYPAAPGVGATALRLNAFGDETAAFNIPGIGTATQLSIYADLMYNDPVFGTGNFTDAFLYAVVDATNVSIYVRKVVLLQTSGGADLPIFIIGTTANMRVYVFTEPGTTSTY